MADILFSTEGEAVNVAGWRDEYPQFFRLLIPDGSTGYSLDIAEPKGWADAPETLDRSERWHGFNYEVLGETKLRFDANSGYEDIVTAFDAYGFDSKITLQFGTTHEGGDTVEFEGVLDLYTKSDDGTTFSCTVKKATLHDKIEPRFDTKLDLYASEDLDGNSIGSFTPTNIILHSKALQEKFTSSFTDNTRTTAGFFTKDTDLYIFPECNTPTVSDIKTFTGKSFGVIKEPPYEFAGGNGYLWDSYSSGPYRFQITWAFTGTVTLIKRTFDVLSSPAITSRQIRAFLVLERNKVRTNYQIGSTSFGGFASSTGFTIDFNGSIDVTLDIQRGDKIYIYAEVKYTYKGVPELKQTNYSFTNVNTSIQVDGKSENDRSGVNGLTVYDALRRSLRQIAGADCLVSDFFNTGCGKYYLIANGFSLRRFADKNPTLSFKDLLESLDAIFFIGYEYKPSTGGQKVSIKKAEDFYSGSEILAFSSCSDYKTEVASQYIFSSLEIGYSKFPEEGINYLDEYNARHEYQLPIEGHENRMSAISSLIGGGYPIETTRREQFSSSPKDSTRYDDDCFIIAYEEKSTQTATRSAVFRSTFVSKTIQLLSLPTFFAVGVNFTVSSTASNNKSYTITDIKIIDTGGAPAYVVYITGNTVTNETASAAVFTSAGISGEAERDDAFESVTNVISPETSYNLRITPKRMLYNRIRMLIPSIYYKSRLTSVIKNTSFKMNGDLTTQFKETETCLLGDIQREELTEKDGVGVSITGFTTELFVPEWISYTVYTERSEWNAIRKALRGVLGSGKDYGYLTVPTPSGGTASGYPFTLSREQNTGKTFVKMIRKS